MTSLSEILKQYYTEKLKLTEKQSKTLQEHKQKNEDRVHQGLQKENTKDSSSPLLQRTIQQGSFAMGTIIKSPNDEYDIDNGVVFNSADIEQHSINELKNLIKKAVTQGAPFKKPPQIKSKCIRVFYDEGHHVDIPVYKSDYHGSELSIATSNGWQDADPEGVTSWFENLVSQYGENIKLLVCFLKAFSKSRSEWDMPSGLVLSKLVEESYIQNNTNLEAIFVDTFLGVVNRLNENIEIDHPVLEEKLTEREKDKNRVKKLKSKMENFKEKLESWDNLADSQKIELLEEVFNSNFFSKETEMEKFDSGFRKGKFGVVGGSISASAPRKSSGTNFYGDPKD